MERTGLEPLAGVAPRFYEARYPTGCFANIDERRVCGISIPRRAASSTSCRISPATRVATRGFNLLFLLLFKSL